jgi:hypothetical protein
MQIRQPDAFIQQEPSKATHPWKFQVIGESSIAVYKESISYRVIAWSLEQNRAYKQHQRKAQELTQEQREESMQRYPYNIPISCNIKHTGNLEWQSGCLVRRVTCTRLSSFV